MTRMTLAFVVASLAVSCQSPSESSPHGNPQASRERLAVWIDTDPSIAPGGKEVDDGFALIQAFHSPELDIRGVSIVHGNTDQDTAFSIGSELVTRFGPSGLKVFRGAHSGEELGRETDASRALAEALTKEKLVVLALGPGTNVGTVLKNHPELSGQIVEVVAVAGRRPGQKFVTGDNQSQPHRDFNFELDADSFQVMFDTKTRVVLTPWEISSQVWLSPTDMDVLEASNPGARFLVQPGRDWLARWKKNFGVDGFNPYDTLAVGYVTSPQLIECDEMGAEIRTLPNDRDLENDPPEKPYLLAAADIQSDSKVVYCHTPKLGFHEDLMARLTAGN